MARSSAGRLLSGLILGAAIGGGLALLASVRSNMVPVEAGAQTRPQSSPTPFEPANVLLNRAQSIVEEVRAQIRQAVAEGRATAAQTRQELTARFEAAKRAPGGDESKG